MSITSAVLEARQGKGGEPVFCDRARGFYISDLLVAKFFGGSTHWVQAPFASEWKDQLQEAIEKALS
eukprot:6016220-Pyramimonas_sp.AAC.1